MHAAAGILTARGGMTSHAAVVARGMGRPCVSGAGALRIDAKAGTLTAGSAVLQQAATSSPSTAHRAGHQGPRADAAAGAVGRRSRRSCGWADEAPHARRARQCRHAARCAPGARLRRRGHRPLPHRAHVLRGRAHSRHARDDLRRQTRSGRRAALAKILPMQRADFERAVRDHGADCRSRSGCSIRRCTSSCRATSAKQAAVAADARDADSSSSRRALRSCPSSIPCWASAAAGSASAIPRSPRCRRARSSRRRSRSRRQAASRSSPRS